MKKMHMPMALTEEFIILRADTPEAERAICRRVDLDLVVLIAARLLRVAAGRRRDRQEPGVP